MLILPGKNQGQERKRAVDEVAEICLFKYLLRQTLTKKSRVTLDFQDYRQLT